MSCCVPCTEQKKKTKKNVLLSSSTFPKVFLISSSSNNIPGRASVSSSSLADVFVINGKSYTCVFGQGLLHCVTLSIAISRCLSYTLLLVHCLWSISNIFESELSCKVFHLIRSTSCRHHLADSQLSQKWLRLITSRWVIMLWFLLL